MDNSSPKIYTEFLPISRADMEARGWDQLDFVVVGGEAGPPMIYISQLSPATLLKRAEENRFE